MCGIAGFVYAAADRDAEATSLARMLEAIAHRGPDDHGLWCQGPVALGQRRLSILDLSPLGHQPIHTADGRFTMIYNGEVYNFAAIRAELETAGHTFKSHGDTEIVLRALAHYGIDAAKKFNGMFAFALWDRQERTLFLVRDRFGIKPLYYYKDKSGIIFGSEIKALLATGEVTKELNQSALHEYFYYGNTLGEHTLFGGIKRLLPGHVLRFKDGDVSIQRYWSANDIAEIDVSAETARDEVRTRLANAVKSHLVSDVPVGVFLSGGIDSSAIATFAARELGEKLKTYSVGFDYDQGVNELPKAKKLAEQLGTDHHELHLSGGSVRDVIEKLVRAHDHPFGDAANIPLFLLARELNHSIKVVLQGDGGDELFAGYRRYNALAWEPLWRLAQSAMSAKKKGFTSQRALRLKRFADAAGNEDPAMKMALLLSEDALKPSPVRVLHPQIQNHVRSFDAFARYRQMNEMFANRDLVQRMLYTDTQVILPDIFLEKVDRSTMAQSIEVRVPFLDNELSEYAMSLPSNLKVRGLKKKWILRQALRGVVPDDILDAPKTGFGVPYGFWLRKPLASWLREVVLDSSLTSTLFYRDVVKDIVDDHISGEADHGFLLYKLLQLGLWYNAYIR